MTPLLALLAFAAAQLAAPPATGDARQLPARPAAQGDLVGTWADVEDDCSSVTVLREDGVFIAPNGGSGNWAVSEGRLILTGPGGSFSWRIVLEDSDTILLVEDNGASSRSFRCPGQPITPQRDKT